MLLATTFLICLAGSLFPPVSSELFLIAAAALAPREALPALVVAATLGQVAGKCMLYLAGCQTASGGPLHRALRLSKRPGFDRLKDRLRAYPRACVAVVALSGVVGLPPLYAISIASGALRIGIGRFALAAGSGRLARHAILVALPSLVR